MRSKTSRTLFFCSGQIFSLIKLQNKLAVLWIPFILIWIRIHFREKWIPIRLWNRIWPKFEQNSNIFFWIFFCKRYNTQNQGWGAGAGRSRLKKKEPEPEPLGKKSQEPEPLQKLAGSSALREDKKRKEVVL